MGTKWLLQLGLALLTMGTHAPVWAAQSPKMVVVFNADGDGPLARQAQAVARTLQDKVALVPLEDYLRAAKSLGYGPQAQLAQEAAVMAGRAIAASHVLIFEPVVVRHGNGRRKTSLQLGVTLIATATGESLLEQRNAKEGSRGAAATQAKIADAVLAALTAAPEPALMPVPAPTPVAAAKPSDGAKAAAPAAAAAPSAAPVVAAPELPPLAPLPPSRATVAQGDKNHGVLATPKAPARPRRKKEGPYGVHFQVGASLFQRVGLVSEGGTPELRYGGAAGRKGPLFSRIVLRLDLQPTRFHGHPWRWWDGLLVFFDGDLGWARTRTSSGRVLAEPNGGWQLGGGWRTPLWRSKVATTLALKLGYSRYGFRVPPASGFFSDNFAGFLAELALEQPLGVPAVSLIGHAGILSALKPLHQTEQLGDRSKKALGGRAEVGLRFLIVGHLEIDATFNWQRYRISYDGPSNVRTFPRSYNGASFSDQSLGGQVRLGLRF